MRPAIRWLWRAVVSSIVASGLCGISSGAIRDHLSWGQIAQGRIYDDPNIATPLYLFLLQVETDASVAYVEFITPTGFNDVIPFDEYTTSGDIETYHGIYDATEVWEYWGYFDSAETLDLYGDGLYTIVLHYTSGAREQTTVWYGIPGTTHPIPTPTQRPSLLWPDLDGVVASPVSFAWGAVTDPGVADVYLNVADANGRYVLADVYPAGTTESDPYGLTEGTYGTELMFEHFHAVANLDGIPFDLLKTSTLLQSFEVVASTVYRFRSAVSQQHFYTIDEAEKNRLIDHYQGVWVFEGPAFYAWATPYDPNLAPVHRFRSNKSGSHFYTVKESEKAKLIQTYAHVWTYEGVAFYAYPPGRQPADASPVYRFWKPSAGGHFYTISATEADRLISQFSDIYTFEGIAYYAYEYQ